MSNSPFEAALLVDSSDADFRVIKSGDDGVVEYSGGTRGSQKYVTANAPVLHDPDADLVEVEWNVVDTQPGQTYDLYVSWDLTGRSQDDDELPAYDLPNDAVISVYEDTEAFTNRLLVSENVNQTQQPDDVSVNRNIAFEKVATFTASNTSVRVNMKNRGPLLVDAVTLERASHDAFQGGLTRLNSVSLQLDRIIVDYTKSTPGCMYLRVQDQNTLQWSTATPSMFCGNDILLYENLYVPLQPNDIVQLCDYRNLCTSSVQVDADTICVPQAGCRAECGNNVVEAGEMCEGSATNENGIQCFDCTYYSIDTLNNGHRYATLDITDLGYAFDASDAPSTVEYTFGGLHSRMKYDVFTAWDTVASGHISNEGILSGDADSAEDDRHVSTVFAEPYDWTYRSQHWAYLGRVTAMEGEVVARLFSQPGQKVLIRSVGWNHQLLQPIEFREEGSQQNTEGQFRARSSWEQDPASPVQRIVENYDVGQAEWEFNVADDQLYDVFLSWETHGALDGSWTPISIESGHWDAQRGYVRNEVLVEDLLVDQSQASDGYFYEGKDWYYIGRVRSSDDLLRISMMNLRSAKAGAAMIIPFNGVFRNIGNNEDRYHWCSQEPTPIIPLGLTQCNNSNEETWDDCVKICEIDRGEVIIDNNTFRGYGEFYAPNSVTVGHAISNPLGFRGTVDEVRPHDTFVDVTWRSEELEPGTYYVVITWPTTDNEFMRSEGGTAEFQILGYDVNDTTSAEQQEVDSVVQIDTSVPPQGNSRHGVVWQNLGIAIVEEGENRVRVQAESVDEKTFFADAIRIVQASPTGTLCGNTVVEEGEQCDDGNLQSGDGCTYNCQTEDFSDAIIATVQDDSFRPLWFDTKPGGYTGQVYKNRNNGTYQASASEWRIPVDAGVMYDMYMTWPTGFGQAFVTYDYGESTFWDDNTIYKRVNQGQSPADVEHDGVTWRYIGRTKGLLTQAERDYIVRIGIAPNTKEFSNPNVVADAVMLLPTHEVLDVTVPTPSSSSSSSVQGPDCGNGVVDDGETCDPNDQATQAGCRTAEWGEFACTRCGDSEIQLAQPNHEPPLEQCDTLPVEGVNCTELCILETECTNNIDDDGDGFIDFDGPMRDPHCDNVLDDDESGEWPQCDDKDDNDGNGLTDYPDDPGCSEETDELESGFSGIPPGTRVYDLFGVFGNEDPLQGPVQVQRYTQGFRNTSFTLSPAGHTVMPNAHWSINPNLFDPSKNIPSGNYDVYVTWPASRPDLGTAQFTFTNWENETGHININQAVSPVGMTQDGLQWQKLSTMWIDGNVPFMLQARPDPAQADGMIHVDAMMLIPSGGSDVPVCGNLEVEVGEECGEPGLQCDPNSEKTCYECTCLEVQIVDNDDALYDEIFVDWITVGDQRINAVQQGAQARWSAFVPKDDMDVYMSWDPSQHMDDAGEVYVEVNSMVNGAPTLLRTMVLDQRNQPFDLEYAGKYWKYLGTHSSVQALNVTMTNHGQRNYLIADAVLFTKRGSLPSPDAALCGNNQPDPGEECDDGGQIDGDGCSASCTDELDVSDVQILENGALIEQNNEMVWIESELDQDVCGNTIGACSDAFTFSTQEEEWYDLYLTWNGTQSTTVRAVVSGASDPVTKKLDRKPAVTRWNGSEWIWAGQNFGGRDWQYIGSYRADSDSTNISLNTTQNNNSYLATDAAMLVRRISGSATCGNGIRETGEQCDEGAANSDTAPFGCRTDCSSAYCGNGVPDLYEECDQGAANSDTTPDACRTDCRWSSCGDGTVDSTEQCDSYGQNTAECLGPVCENTYCGDGIRQNQNGTGTGGPDNDGQEECDYGPDVTGDGCTAWCEDEIQFMNVSQLLDENGIGYQEEIGAWGGALPDQRRSLAVVQSRASWTFEVEPNVIYDAYVAWEPTSPPGAFSATAIASDGNIANNVSQSINQQQNPPDTIEVLGNTQQWKHIGEIVPSGNRLTVSVKGLQGVLAQKAMIWRRDFGAAPVCGDGDIVPPETCDPTLPGVPGCRAVGDVGACTYCGDSTLNGPETCDFNAASGSTDNPAPESACRVFGDDQCTFCGDGITQIGAGEQCDGGENCSDTCLNIVPETECNDGIDNDLDGDTDNQDGGCTDAEDTSERQFDGPQCDNGFNDNDNDALADYPDDPDCTGPDDDNENTDVVDPFCGDGEINGDETCDPEATNPISGCRPVGDFNECTYCGDDNVDNDGPVNEPPAEECDGGLNCNPDCTLIVTTPECSDGEDNDNNGLIDTADPGCGNDPNNLEEAGFHPAATMVLVDNEEPAYTDDGDWNTWNGGHGTNFRYAPAVPSNAAQWEFDVMPNVTYQVYGTWEPASDKASDAPFSFKENGLVIQSQDVNQETLIADMEYDGSNWQAIGTPITIGDGNTELMVELTGDADKHVVADAVMLVPTLIQPSTACTDEIDNDGDGLIDFGITQANDPGCLSVDDDDERQLDGPQCDNGINDNDNDALADYPDDPDCSGPDDDTEDSDVIDPFCGDNEVNGDETCDGTPGCRPAGDPGECTYCGDEQRQTEAGEACDSTPDCDSNCTLIPVGPVCGDTIKNGTETCDYAAFANSTDNPAGFGQCRETGADACTYCGDGVVDPSETCDGTPGCRASETAAQCTSCGDGITQIGVEDCDTQPGCHADCTWITDCNDDVDNDGDGLKDFGEDPGCIASDDTSERQADGATCDNGVDDDNDGDTDFPADDGCRDALDSDEDAVVDLVLSYPPLSSPNPPTSERRSDGVRYVVAVANQGQDTATNVSVTDTYTENLVFNAVKSSSVCRQTGPTVTCDGFDLTAPKADTGPLQLHGAWITGGELGFMYSNTTGNCAHPKVGLNSLGNLACTSGTMITKFVDASGFSPALTTGMQIKICNSNNAAQCSQELEITSEPVARKLSIAFSVPTPDTCDATIDNTVSATSDAGGTTTLPAVQTDIWCGACEDGLDNDDDGGVDLDDFSCENDPSNTDELNPRAQCDDGIDNDGNGLIDFGNNLENSDEGCIDKNDNDESGHIAQCIDGIDNDDDSLIDFGTDPGCTSQFDNFEGTFIAQCDDDFDNDGNGYIDFENDPGCESLDDNDESGFTLSPVPAATIVDNADVGFTLDVFEPAAQTSDSAYYNGSAMTTSSNFKVIGEWRLASRPSATYDVYASWKADPGNTDRVRYHVFGTPEGSPDTVIANQRDIPDVTMFGQQWKKIATGVQTTAENAVITVKADKLDPGVMHMDAIMIVPTTPFLHECNDGIDNDDDGVYDFPDDFSCSSGTDNFENTPVAECQDGNDNDNNGLVDHPDDPGCASTQDNDESGHVTFCGDGVTQSPNSNGETEQCDTSDSSCDSNCQWTFCGDGTPQSPNGLDLSGTPPGFSEECDDDNTDEDDLCNNECLHTRCGDGIPQSPNGEGTGGPANDGHEECDDGSLGNLDTCTNSCSFTYCGDGLTQKPNGRGIGGPANNGHEECDDNNNDDGDGCSSTCEIEDTEPLTIDNSAGAPLFTQRGPWSSHTGFGHQSNVRYTTNSSATDARWHFVTQPGTQYNVYATWKRGTLNIGAGNNAKYAVYSPAGQVDINGDNQVNGNDYAFVNQNILPENLSPADFQYPAGTHWKFIGTIVPTTTQVSLVLYGDSRGVIADAAMIVPDGVTSIFGCGDGHLIAPETCDPGVPGVPNCRRAGQLSECTYCGDDIVQPALEECDGELGCTTTCMWSQCSNQLDDDADGAVDLLDFSCDDENDDDETNPESQCQDDVDNDTNGLIDYPADLGCTDAQDNTESGFTPVIECDDDVDNDNNGLTDLLDPGCDDAGDLEESGYHPAATMLVVDNTDDDFNLIGSWSQWPGGYGPNFRFVAKGDGSKKAQWNFSVLPNVEYQVYGMWRPDENKASDAPFTFYENGTTVLAGPIPVNQETIVSDMEYGDEDWQKIGDPITISDGVTSLRVELTNDADQHVVADAVILMPTLTRAQCEDEIDNDGDGAVDFPDDVRCFSPEDDDEGDNNPQCQDGLDNDTDALIDMADSDCADVTDNSESAFTTLFIDNDDAGFTTIGSWGTISDGYNDSSRYHSPGDGSSIAEWSFNVEPNAAYQVYATWDAQVLFNANNTPFTFYKDGVLVTPSVIRVDQTVLPSETNGHGYPWEPIGPPITMDSSTNTFTVRVSNFSTSNSIGNRNVIADAVWLVPTEPVPACSNGYDDDGDGFTDFDGTNGDSGCSSANDTDESSSTGTPVIIDDQDASPAFSLWGSWGLDNTLRAYGGTMRTAIFSAGTKKATWMLSDAIPGVEYAVYVTWPHQNPIANTAAQYSMKDGDNVLPGYPVSMNQNLPPALNIEGHQWMLLGKTTVTTGPLSVVLHESIGSAVRADAVLFIPLQADPVCGDNEVNGTETCDPTAPGAPANCRSAAAVASCTYCGDLETQTDANPPEQCDGEANCNIDCTWSTACNDGVDNDSDGLFDLLDPGCADSTDDSERDPAGPACDNGSDDDIDTFADFPDDPGCSGPTDTSERNAAGPACDNGIDDDGDLFADYGNLPVNDPGCDSPTDTDESNPMAAPQRIILDDHAHQAPNPTKGQFTKTPNWTVNSNVTSGWAYNQNLHHAPAGNGSRAATWQFDGSVPGVTYDIYVTWKTEINRANNAPFFVFDGPALLSGYPVRINQKVFTPPVEFYEGYTWQKIGTETVVNGPLKVTMTNDANGFVIADAVMIVPQGPPPPAPLCGDGAVNGSETCDESDGNDPVSSILCRDAGTPAECTYCGDQITQSPTEECDGEQNCSVVCTWLPECMDNLDNDNNGFTDYPSDPGCTSMSDADESGFTAQCNDGADNDGDGATDYPADFSCSSASDTDEENPKAMCQDGNDNDNNGLTDYPADLGCNSLQDDLETGFFPTPECDDDTDNDNNGLTDFPDDPGCESDTDVDESGFHPAATTLLIDNSDTTNGEFSVVGSWNNWTNDGYNGSLRYTNTAPAKKAQWHFDDVLPNVTYQVYATWTPDANRATNAPYRFYEDGTQLPSIPDPVNQEVLEADMEYEGYNWEAVGDPVTISDGVTEFMVELGANADQNVIADAVMLVPTLADPQCNDGSDNDGDGATDYPADFSCDSPDDSDEEFPLTECQDGIDNDGINGIDLADQSCVDEQDNTEFVPVPPVFSLMTAGDVHTCLNKGGSVACWGANDNGELGDGTNSPSFAPVDVVGLTSGVSKIDAAYHHTCAIQNGGVKCWGYNIDKQLGDGSSIHRWQPVQVIGLTTGVTDIDVMKTRGCAIQNGGVTCWGNSADPAQVPGLTSNVSAVSTGISHACAIHNGAAKCWGINSKGQLGNGSTVNSSTPVQVSGLTSGVTAIAVGRFYSCAIHNGALKCWGDNSEGQLGNGSTTDSTVPVQVNGLSSGVTAVETDEYDDQNHTCAIHNGAAKCWGESMYGQLGNGSLARSTVPAQVSGLANDVSVIDMNKYHNCAVRNGAMRCWGKRWYGQLGNGSIGHSTPQLTSVPVTGLTSGVEHIAVGRDHTCAVHDGAAKCWGHNQFNQLGIGASTPTATPAPWNVSGLDAILCGNLAQDPGEDCDGEVGCLANCMWSACSNNTDDDSDSLVDFGNDPGCDSANDNDESNAAICGDAIVTSPETCDPTAPGAPGNCRAATAAAPCTYCGDDVTQTTANPPEQCDGELNCSDTCTLLSVCSDGIDNDNDGAIDYPADFSCTSPADTNESAPKSQCEDGIDNDNNGHTDYGLGNLNDPGCSDRQDNTESGHVSFCGDGVPNQPNSSGTTEECDPGSASMSDVLPDACRTNCMLPHCGDNVTDSNGVDGPEQCDGEPNCAADCTLHTGICGDGTIDTPNSLGVTEQCDPGLINMSDVFPNACRRNCMLPHCGDNVTDSNGIDGPEQCDGEDFCLPDCTVAVATDAFKMVDDADLWFMTADIGWVPHSSSNAMNNMAKKARGTPFVPGNIPYIRYATWNFTNTIPGAQYKVFVRWDPKSTNSTQVRYTINNSNTVFFANQRLAPSIALDSVSDITVPPGHAALQHLWHPLTTVTAVSPLTRVHVHAFGSSAYYMADAVVLAQVTNAPTKSQTFTPLTLQTEGPQPFMPLTFRSATTEPVCGDTNVDAGEQCDDGNTDPDDACSNDCQWTFCGDGIPQSQNGDASGGPQNDGAEECDDGNIDSSDDCALDCSWTYCGDGIRQEPNGEGGYEECDGTPDCNAFCQIIDGPVCGNGTLETGEDCDGALGSCGTGESCNASSCQCEPVETGAPVIFDENEQASDPLWQYYFADNSTAYEKDVIWVGPGNPGAVARWNANVPAGIYEVYTTWTPNENRSRSTMFSLMEGGTVLADGLSINQQTQPNDLTELGYDWEKIDTVTISQPLTIEMTTSEFGVTVADAIMLKPVGTTPPPVDPPAVACGNGQLEEGEECDGSPLHCGDEQFCDTQCLCIDIPDQSSVCGDGNKAPDEQCEVDSDCAVGTCDDQCECTDEADPPVVELQPIIKDEEDALPMPPSAWIPYQNAESLFYGRDTLYADPGEDNTVTWSFDVSANPGRYKVYATWTAHSARTQQILFDVSEGQTTLIADQEFNQRVTPSDRDYDGSAWAEIGEVTVTSNITVTLKTTRFGISIADAVMIVPLQDGHSSAPVCGDGLAEPDRGEQCNEPNLSCGVHQSCNTNTCLCEDIDPPSGGLCGNDFIDLDAGEECDGSNDGCSGDDTCNLSLCLCEAPPPPEPVCGNGIPEDGEDCDDGNTSQEDSCLNDCTRASCGDTYTHDGVEECDDGNGVDDDGCTNQCIRTFCGDGDVQAPNGDGIEEQCEDRNTDPNDGCDQCRITTPITVNPVSFQGVQVVRNATSVILSGVINGYDAQLYGPRTFNPFETQYVTYFIQGQSVAQRLQGALAKQDIQANGTFLKNIPIPVTFAVQFANITLLSYDPATQQMTVEENASPTVINNQAKQVQIGGIQQDPATEYDPVVELQIAQSQVPTHGIFTTRSQDGRYLVYLKDSNVYLFDRTADTRTLIMEPSESTMHFLHPVLSGNGRWVVVRENSTVQQQGRIWLIDTQTNQKTSVSVKAFASGAGTEFAPRIANDGQTVVFIASHHPNTDTDPTTSYDNTDGGLEVFLWTKSTLQTRQITNTPAGNTLDNLMYHSADGKIVFRTNYDYLFEDWNPTIPGTNISIPRDMTYDVPTNSFTYGSF